VVAKRGVAGDRLGPPHQLTQPGEMGGENVQANARLWGANAGMYRDNPTSTLYPQDGNALAVWFGLTDSPAKATSIAAKLSTRWNAFGATTPEWGSGVHPFTGAMEVHAHFTANDDFTALAQIRRTWGYMLDSPIGTRSTFWEGINADGSLAYGGSYMSLAHGWSSGPTSALTFHLLGTAPETQVGQYRFVPHPGDLTSAEGRITLPQGQLNAAWSRNPGAGTYTGAPCAFTGQRTVAYGARGAFVYRTFTGGTPCTTAAFATDPLNGISKSCYFTP
jgi:hypothetical protein